MILPPEFRGVAFGTRSQGDGRFDGRIRTSISDSLRISPDWATVTQTRSSRVVFAAEPGHYGNADALVTDVPGLPIVIATADCVPVVLIGGRTRAVVHAGWRGVAAGVVFEAVSMLRARGDEPEAVLLGPHIGPCCYEVGREVVEAVGGFARSTRAGTTSVDLAAAIAAQLEDIPMTDLGRCTHDDPHLASYREDGTSDRQVTIAWVPRD